MILRNKFVLLILLVQASVLLYSQEDEMDLALVLDEKKHLIESIDPSFPTTDDLAFLKDELLGVKVVMLGEQSHGDGSTFEAKTRLIKYLHEEMGFNVLVFESGLMDMYRTWEKISEGADSVSVFNYGMFPVWANSKQVQYLLNYVIDQSKTDHPLIISGFDMQPTGANMTQLKRWDEIRAYLSITTEFNEENYPRFSNAFQDLGSVVRAQLDSEELESLIYEFKEIGTKISLADQSPQGRIFVRYIDNYLKTIILYTNADLRNPPNTPHVFNIRDREMARNFEWLTSSLYPGEKYIVWGANTHLGYGRGFLNSFEGNPPSAPAMVPFGQYLKIDYQDALYSIAFTSYEGAVGSLRGGIRDLPPGHGQSLEKRLADLDFPYAFVSLRSTEFKSYRFPARIYGHAEMSGIWGQMADGVFFIKTMKPSESIK